MTPWRLGNSTVQDAPHPCSSGHQAEGSTCRCPCEMWVYNIPTCYTGADEVLWELNVIAWSCDPPCPWNQAQHQEEAKPQWDWGGGSMSGVQGDVTLSGL